MNKLEEVQEAIRIKNRTVRNIGPYGNHPAYLGALYYSKEKGKLFEECEYVGDACFADIERFHTAKLAYIILHSGKRHEGLEEPEYNYLSWIIKRSPFSSFLLSKNIENTYKYGAIFNPHKVSSRGMVATASAIRFLHEYPSAVRSWDKINRVIKNENLAFIFANNMVISGRMLKRITIPGHGVFSSNTCLLQYRNFLTNTIVFNTPYMENVTYSPLSSLWGKFSYGGDWFLKNIKERETRALLGTMGFLIPVSGRDISSLHSLSKEFIQGVNL